MGRRECWCPTCAVPRRLAGEKPPRKVRGWYTVATYCEPGESRRSKVHTYTRDWSCNWPGCIPFHVKAANGGEARAKAVALRLEAERLIEARETARRARGGE